MLFSTDTLLPGFWSLWGVLDALKALQINLTGGEDYTEVIDACDYDDFTNEI